MKAASADWKYSYHFVVPHSTEAKALLLQQEGGWALPRLGRRGPASGVAHTSPPGYRKLKVGFMNPSDCIESLRPLHTCGEGEGPTHRTLTDSRRDGATLMSEG